MLQGLRDRIKKQQSLAVLAVVTAMIFYGGQFLIEETDYIPQTSSSAGIVIGLLQELASINIDASLVHRVAELDTSEAGVSILPPQPGAPGQPVRRGNGSQSFLVGKSNPFQGSR